MEWGFPAREAESSFRGGRGCEGLKERGTSRRGEGGRKCLLCVTVFADGVRDGAVLSSQKHSYSLRNWCNSPPGRGEPGTLVSTRGRGLSLGLIERDEGAREAIIVSFEHALAV